MPRPFYEATAEQVVIVTEAVVSLGDTDSAKVAAFCDLPPQTAESALRLAADLNLLREDAGTFAQASTLCPMLRTPQDREKAAILRVTIESYEPFRVFREELDATSDVSEAAQRTRAKLDLTSHREQIKVTILSLATYSGALVQGQGNSYVRDAKGLTALLEELAASGREEAEATLTIQRELGPDAVGMVDHNHVILPMVAGLRHAAANAGREAVLQAGIAVESFLVSVAAHHATNIGGANGISAKMDRLVNAGHYPPKLQNVCRYLGHIRNAADHGDDAEIAAPWSITSATGRNYVFVAVQFVASMVAHRLGQHRI